MKKLKFILHENVDRLDENGKLLPNKVTTLGFKFEANGVWYGDYMILNKPTATVQDIMSLLEGLCPLVEQALEMAKNEEMDDEQASLCN